MFYSNKYRISQNFIFLVISVTLFITVPCANATVWYVDIDNAAGPWTGSSWGTAFKTIQEGVDSASTAGGGEVWVAEGTYTGTNIAVLIMKQDVHIYGGFKGTENSKEDRLYSGSITIIDGEEARGCFIGADNSTIDRFLLKKGNMEIQDADYREFYESLGEPVAHCAAEATNVAIIISNCTFLGSSPSTDEFMADLILKNSTYQITGCSFIGGTVVSVTAAGVQGGTCIVYLDKCSINDSYMNIGANQGTSSLIATNCIFINPLQGKGIVGKITGSSTCTINAQNCTFYKCGITTESLFSENHIAVEANNCIIVDGSILGSEGFATVSNSCISGGFPGSGNIDVDPLFVDVSNRDLHLRYNSPCIDLGGSVGAPNTDIEGNIRPMGDGVDMGAYETRPVFHMINDPDAGQGQLFWNIVQEKFPSLYTVFQAQGWTSWSDLDMENLDKVIIGIMESPGDGIPDEWQMAMVEYVLGNPKAKFYNCVNNQFYTNRSLIQQDLTWLASNADSKFSSLQPTVDLLASLMGTSDTMRDTIHGLVLFLSSGASGLPHQNDYQIFGISCTEKNTDEPFSAQGNFDGDSFTNLEEYQQVKNVNGGSPDIFAMAATDPTNEWPGHPNASKVPITGKFGLMLVSTMIVFMARKKLKRT